MGGPLHNQISAEVAAQAQQQISPLLQMLEAAAIHVGRERPIEAAEGVVPWLEEVRCVHTQHPNPAVACTHRTSSALHRPPSRLKALVFEKCDGPVRHRFREVR